jgi:isoquinoline 1-oxidoreductase beta subunit
MLFVPKTLPAPPLPRPHASRRAFLKGSAASAGLFVLATTLDWGSPSEAATGDGPPMPNAFVQISSDDTVTVIIKHLDMGQGIATGLATIVAEELDAAWSQVRTEFAPANAQLYNNLMFGPIQGTGGSTSTANSWMQLRRAGAAARAMMVGAAASQWQVPADEIQVSEGTLSHPSGKHARFGELAADAVKQPVPTDVTLKRPDQFKLIGSRLPRLDSKDKTTGQTRFALDIRRPGMKTAVLARSPRFGGRVKSFEASAALSVKGVVDVIALEHGVAVIADTTWAAMRGRDALSVRWDDSAAERRSSDEILADYRAKAASGSGTLALRRGEPDAAMQRASRILEAEFSFPYLAHAPMEPLNCVIEQHDDGTCDVWAGAQLPTIEQMAVANTLGLALDKVRLHTVWAGGSFGRRATPNADYFLEAAAIAKAIGTRYPLHFVYSREDDIRGGRYRPMFYHKIKVGLDASGRPIAWQQRLVGQSFMIGSPFEFMVKDGLDPTAVEGAADMPYAIPALEVDWHNVRSPVTTLWWRSVGHTHTAQAVEVMIDELASAAGQDPLAFRLSLLPDRPRHQAVLRLAAEKAGYGERLPAGRGRGIAVHESFDSFVAMVADVSVAPGGVKVDRLVVAVDCGIVINPDIVVAQIEGGAGFGLGAALRNKITLTEGVVDQSNFDSYEPLRITDMPVIEVHIVKSDAPPTGIGEPGVPPVAPAVANAIFAATGKRLRSLPFDFNLLHGA